MKKLIIAIACATLLFDVTAQIKMPAPSPTQTVSQAFGMGSINITYSRPVMKGRKVMGNLVPFGEVWRTGANAATIIRFTAAVEIQGKKIDTGSYALYTIPGADNWQIVLNRGITNWGSDGYDEKADVARFIVKKSNTAKPVESFTIQFTDVKPTTCNLEIMWERTSVVLPIVAYNLTNTIKADIEKAIATNAKKPYWQAAQFYNEFDNNPTKALQYINSAVEENPKAFYMWLYKAKIEMAMGDKAAAKTSANKSLELSKEAKNNDYIKMNMDLLKKL